MTPAQQETIHALARAFRTERVETVGRQSCYACAGVAPIDLSATFLLCKDHQAQLKPLCDAMVLEG